jgi:L-seryl-tRNA(Ser) seleniumtransferase
LIVYRDPERARREIPVLAMLDCDERSLDERTQRLVQGIGSAAVTVRAAARVGGGALPLLELEGPAVALSTDASAVALARALRDGHPPVVARIHDGRVLLDPRTLRDADIAAAIGAVRRALQTIAGE